MKPTVAAALLVSTLTACERIVTGTDLAPAPLQIDSSSLPDGQVGAPYAAALSASGGVPPYQFSIAAGALPAGLALATDGTISGTPQSPGAYAFSANVGDSATPPQTSGRSLSILVAPAPGPLAITTATLPQAQRGIAYQFTLLAANGTPPYSWSVSSGSLPPGIVLSGEGVLGGTPSKPGTSVFTATVVDAAAAPQTASRQLSLTVR